MVLMCLECEWGEAGGSTKLPSSYQMSISVPRGLQGHRAGVRTPGDTGTRNAEGVFNGDRASVWEDGKSAGDGWG